MLKVGDKVCCIKDYYSSNDYNYIGAKLITDKIILD